MSVTKNFETIVVQAQIKNNKNKNSVGMAIRLLSICRHGNAAYLNLLACQLYPAIFHPWLNRLGIRALNSIVMTI